MGTISKKSLRQRLQPVTDLVWKNLFLMNEESVNPRAFAYLLIIINAVQLFSYHAFFVLEGPNSGTQHMNLLELIFKVARGFRLTTYQSYLGVFSPFIIAFCYQLLLLILMFRVLLIQDDTSKQFKSRILRKITMFLYFVYEWVLFLPCTELVFQKNTPSVYLPQRNSTPINRHDSTAFFVLYVVVYSLTTFIMIRRGVLAIYFKEVNANRLARTRQNSYVITFALRFFFVFGSCWVDANGGHHWLLELVLLVVFPIIFAFEPYRLIFVDKCVATCYMSTCFLNWIWSWALLYVHLNKNTEYSNGVVLIGLIVSSFGLRLYLQLREEAIRRFRTKCDFSTPYSVELNMRHLVNFALSVRPNVRDGLDFFYLVADHNRDCTCADCECHEILRENTDFKDLRISNRTKDLVFSYVHHTYRFFFDYHAKDKKFIFPFFIRYLSLLTYTMNRKATAFLAALEFLQKIDKSSYDAVVLQLAIKEIGAEIEKEITIDGWKFFHLQISDSVKFYEKKEEFDLSIEKVKKHRTEFFQHLLNDEIDLNFVYGKGKSYLSLRNDVKSYFEQLMKLNPVSVDVLEQYINYHRDVIDSPISDYRIFNKKRQELVLKHSYQVPELNLKNADVQLWNPENAVVFLSLSQAKPGIIEACTPAFAKIFGLKSAKEALGYNINRFMPAVIGKTHDDILRKFAARPDLEVSRKNIIPLLFGVNAEGYLVPISMIVKLEAYNQKSTVASIIRPLKEEYVSIFTCWEGKILNYTRLFKEFLNLPAPDTAEGIHICFLIPKLLKFMHVSKEEEMLFDQISTNQERFYLILSEKIANKKYREKLIAKSDEVYQSIIKLVANGNDDLITDEIRADVKKRVKKEIFELQKDYNPSEVRVFRVKLTMRKMAFQNGRSKYIYMNITFFREVRGDRRKELILLKHGFTSRKNYENPNNEGFDKLQQMPRSSSHSEIPDITDLPVPELKKKSHSSNESAARSILGRNSYRSNLDTPIMGEREDKIKGGQFPSNPLFESHPLNLSAAHEFDQGELKPSPGISNILSARRADNSPEEKLITDAEKLRQGKKELERKETVGVPREALVLNLSRIGVTKLNTLDGTPNFSTMRGSNTLNPFNPNQHLEVNKLTDTTDNTANQSAFDALDSNKGNEASQSEFDDDSFKSQQGSSNLLRKHLFSSGTSHYQSSDTTNKLYRDMVNSNASSVLLQGLEKLGLFAGLSVIILYLLIALISSSNYSHFQELTVYLYGPSNMVAGLFDLTLQIARLQTIVYGLLFYLNPANINLFMWDAFWVNWITGISYHRISESFDNYTSLDGVDWISGALLQYKKIELNLKDGNMDPVVELPTALGLINYYSYAINFLDITTIENSRAYVFFLDNKDALLNLTLEIDLHNQEVIYELQDKAKGQILTITLIAIAVLFVVFLNFYWIIIRTAQYRQQILILFTKISVQQILAETKRFELTTEKAANSDQGQEQETRERIFSTFKVRRKGFGVSASVGLFIAFLALCVPSVIICVKNSDYVNESVEILTRIADTASSIRQLRSFQIEAYNLMVEFNQPKDIRQQHYEDSFLPAYNQALNGTKNLRNFLFEMKSSSSILNRETKELVFESINGDFCTQLPLVDPADVGISLSDFGLTLQDIINHCRNSFGGISAQGIIVAQEVLINAVAQDAQKAVEIEQGDYASFLGIISGKAFYDYDKFGLYIGYFDVILAQYLIDSGGARIRLAKASIIIASVVSIVSILVFLGFLWLTLLKKMNTKLRRAKQILNILPHNILSRNVYIQSFLKKEASRRDQ